MSQEIELKLTISENSIDSFLRLGLIEGLVADVFVLENTYFDTPDQQLTQAGSALRIRKKGDGFLQTLKNQGVNIGGLHKREEWEMPIPENRLDLSLFPAGSLPESLSSEALAPLFHTNFTRQSWLLTFKKSQIELVLDTGKVSSAQGSDPISELELELKAGELSDLFAFALILSKHVAVMPSDISKAERGYRLCQSKYDAEVDLPELVAEQSMESAFYALFGYEMERLQRQWQMFWSTQQWRHLQGFLNTLGNMEAELEWFHDMLPSEQSSFVSAHLNWMQQALCPILSWWPACFALSQDAEADPKNIAISLQQCKAKKAIQKLRGLLNDPELGHRMLLLTAWLHSRDWQVDQNESHLKVAHMPVSEGLDCCFNRALNALQSDCFAGSASHALSQSPAVSRLLTLCHYFEQLHGQQLGNIQAPLQALNDTLSRLSAMDVVVHLKDWLSELPVEQQASVHSWTRSSTVLLRDIKQLANRLIQSSRGSISGGHI